MSGNVLFVEILGTSTVRLIGEPAEELVFCNEYRMQRFPGDTELVRTYKDGSGNLFLNILNSDFEAKNGWYQAVGQEGRLSKPIEGITDNGQAE